MVAHGTPACSGGSCVLAACDTGFRDCDSDLATGCEVDSNASVMNCGACGNACGGAGPNQQARCTLGTCVVECMPGFAHCGANPADGCEVHVLDDVKHCGACGASCGTPANAVPRCNAAHCEIASCNAPFKDCNARLDDGCETNVGQDARSCGNCGLVCPAIPNATPVCAGGVCAAGMCNPGFANCDALPGNGCEIAIATDARNCGACARACGGANSKQACQAGMCVVAGCDPGFSDCDSQPETGCEVNVSTDVKHCGGCGRACPRFANATSTCANAQCGIGMCQVGFADCNNAVMDGCEADLLSPTSCGKCGNACAAPANATAGCKNGMCGIGVCHAGFADCDGNAANGCEKGVLADLTNCGACGKVCSFANAQPGCLNGQCGILACNNGFADCDKNAGNGCEITTSGDVKNCGGCGAQCQVNQVCLAGVCKNGVKVLLVHAEMVNPNFAGEVQLRLANTGAFTAVDLFAASAATPTVQQLQAYDSVLVWSNANFLNTNALGDNLATYYDGGGHVVVAVYALGGFVGGLIGGRFGAAQNGYILLQPMGPQAINNAASLGQVSEPNSPLMAGVNTLSAAGARRGPGPVVNNGVVVAYWNDNTPMIIRGVVQGRSRVDLNIYPVSSAVLGTSWTGDGTAIFKNALLYR